MPCLRYFFAASLAAFAAFTFSAGIARAEESPVAENRFNVVGNISLASQYRWRGLTQTWGGPALQGGIDIAHASGLYAGLWASNVSRKSFPGGSVEVDYYAGYNGQFNEDWGWTVGGYGYAFPGANFNKQVTPNQPSAKWDMFEVNSGVNWRWASYKLSYSATDYFSNNADTGFTGSTRGTLYHDLTVNYPISYTLTLDLHAGHTSFKRNQVSGINSSYSDYKVGLTQTFRGGWNISGSYVWATNDAAYQFDGSLTDSQVMAINKGTFLIAVGRTF